MLPGFPTVKASYRDAFMLQWRSTALKKFNIPSPLDGVGHVHFDSGMGYVNAA